MRYKLIVAGTSLGGLRALSILLAGLPEDFGLPLAIVQHRRSDSPAGLSNLLQTYSALTIEEVEDKMPIMPGRVYLAPPGYHLLVEQDYFALSTEGPVQYTRPAIDVLFESAARTYGSSLIGVVLTGANRDGAKGAAQIKKYGGVVVVQDLATAESPVMPQATLNATVVDRVLPLEQIASCLVELDRTVESANFSGKA
jgi:two-component system chemotaxis response regulator CheB